MYFLLCLTTLCGVGVIYTGLSGAGFLADWFAGLIIATGALAVLISILAIITYARGEWDE